MLQEHVSLTPEVLKAAGADAKTADPSQESSFLQPVGCGELARRQQLVDPGS